MPVSSIRLATLAPDYRLWLIGNNEKIVVYDPAADQQP
jgi:hypothetical protein